MNREIKSIIFMTFLTFLGLIFTLTLAPGTGEDIPVIAYIENAEPEVLYLSILDSAGSPTTYVDPGCQFFIDIRLRDNNTLSDIYAIEVILYSPDSTCDDDDQEQHHYTFKWNSSGFSNVGGVGSLRGGCEEPYDLTLGEGTWRFSVELAKQAIRSSGWRVLIRATDESNLTESSENLEVTRYISLSVNANEITFSGSPSQTVASDQNPIDLNYSTNHEAGIGCYCSDFVGSSNPDLVISPSSFKLDDDDDPYEDVETDVQIKTLSKSRQNICEISNPGSGTFSTYVYITIPEPFMDQDYVGTLAFEMYS